MNLYNSKTEQVLEYFHKICQIPRCSGSEDKVRGWLRCWADSHSFPVQSDAAGNLLINVPATPGHSSRPALALQCHMDMVCEKNADSRHDFTRDPIQTYQQGDWLHATDTTLGADNGIGMAIALTVATSESIHHPPLELLFTTDEESGLVGVSRLPTDLLQSKRLINLDGESAHRFIIGCAGGVNSRIHIPMQKRSPSIQESVYLQIEVGGMASGHSGLKIHKGSANAIKTLVALLKEVSLESDIQLRAFNGGTYHNVIPAQAVCEIGTPTHQMDAVFKRIDRFRKATVLQYHETDPTLFFKSRRIDDSPQVPLLNWQDSLTAINFLHNFPHGSHTHSSTLSGVVETSNNLAQASLEDTGLSILSSQRSLFNSGRDLLTRQIAKAVQKHGGTCVEENGYSAWQPDMNSILLQQCRKTHKRLFPREDLYVEVLHAGLECGVIGEKYPDMDMISLGPTIDHPHTPAERVNLLSLDRFLVFFIELLEELTGVPCIKRTHTMSVNQEPVS
jgi:dipeptidase D